MLSAALLTPFQSLLNRNIAASTPARGLLAELAGRSFAVEVGTPLGGRLLRVRLEAGPAGLSIAGGDAPADASVSGTPLALAALLGKRAAGDLAGSGVTIGGDAEIARAFEKLLLYARPDLEEEFARLAGDAPAHYAGLAARGVLDWAQKARASIARNVGEFLTEESRDLVPRAELDVFLGDVDRVRDDVERAAARLAVLERTLHRRPSST